jgi:hypothetical protein
LITVAVVFAVVLGLAVHRWWTTPRVVRSGPVTLAVDRHYLPHPVGGVGFGGTLALVKGRCLGTVGTTGAGAVLVWPPGTSIGSDGIGLVVHSRGHTFRLGDQLLGGSEQRTDFPGLRSRLPRECRDAELVDFDPDG